MVVITIVIIMMMMIAAAACVGHTNCPSPWPEQGIASEMSVSLTGRIDER